MLTSRFGGQGVGSLPIRRWALSAEQTVARKDFLLFYLFSSKPPKILKISNAAYRCIDYLIRNIIRGPFVCAFWNADCLDSLKRAGSLLFISSFPIRRYHHELICLILPNYKKLTISLYFACLVFRASTVAYDTLGTSMKQHLDFIVSNRGCTVFQWWARSLLHAFVIRFWVFWLEYPINSSRQSSLE